MKTSITLLLAGICIAGWYAEDLSRALHQAQAAKAPAQIRVSDMMAAPEATGRVLPISAEQYARSADSDPQAYRKFVQSHTVESERGAADKLMNFLARGKYE